MITPTKQKQEEQKLQQQQQRSRECDFIFSTLFTISYWFVIIIVIFPCYMDHDSITTRMTTSTRITQSTTMTMTGK